MNRFRTALVLAVCLLTVCVVDAAGAKYDEKSLVGTWEFDMVKMMKAAAEAGELPPEVDIEAMAKNMHVSITFNEDGTYVFLSKTMGNDITESGRWKIVKSEGATVIMSSTGDDGEEQTVTMVFADKDHFDAIIQEGENSTTMSAVRVKKAEKDKEKDE